MAIIAIDAGTSTLKAVAFDALGRELYVARRDSEVERPREGWSEQDMNLVWERVCACVREVAQAVKTIEAITITAQGDGCWLIDSEGQPVRPALLWNDARAAGYVNEWRTDDTVARGYARNGSVPFPGLSNALLRWIADNEPQSLSKSAYALTCGGWIYYKMTGEIRGEPSDTFVPFVDLATGKYSDELLSLYGVEHCKRLLPPIGADTGSLSAEGAARIELSAGLPVILAPYDVPSAALGVGASEPRDAIAVLGTTFLCGIVDDTPRNDGEPAGCLIPLGLPSRYLRFHATLAGMEVAHWAAIMLGLTDARELITLAAGAPPGANGVMFLPYLSPAGERAPFLEPAARGSFWNLSLDHDRADMARSVVEGLCMVVRDCFEAIGGQPTSVRLSGGGTTNAVLCQLLADVLGRSVRRAAASELTCRGAALYATLSMGERSALSTWRSTADAEWTPDLNRASFYTKHFADFQRLRQLAAQGWRGHGERSRWQ